MSEKTEYGWLIEAPGTQYLEAHKMGNGYYFRWTRDHDKAIRFHSEEQADLTMMAIRTLAPKLFDFANTLGMSRPVEHGWG